MTLVEVGRISLPTHTSRGGFDHAAVDPSTDRLYVAHTANDSVDVIDLSTRKYLRSLSGLRGVAGVWVNERRRLLFTSNRGEHTASVFRIGTALEEERFRVPTGVRPNGMAFDAESATWLIAGVGDAATPNAPPTLTFVSAERGERLGQLRAPGRTRWATYHALTRAFYVAVADPPALVSVRSDDLSRIAEVFPIPATGPHGLEHDAQGTRVYCAADAGGLFSLDVTSGETVRIGPIEGTPDVIWLDSDTGLLYVATDEPATVQVFSPGSRKLHETFPTSPGAHTLTLDRRRHEIHVFLPETHEDLVLADRPLRLAQ